MDVLGSAVLEFASGIRFTNVAMGVPSPYEPLIHKHTAEA